MTLVTAPALRPLTLGQILDQAIRLYRRNFWKFIGIIAIVQVPLSLLQLGVSLWNVQSLEDTMYSDTFTPAYFASQAANLLLMILSYVLVQGVATAAMTRAIGSHYLGAPISLLDAYRKVGRSWLRLLGALTLAFVIGIGLVIWLLIPCVGWVTGLGMLLFFGWVIIPLIAPIVVIEGRSGGSAILRVWELVRKRFWWVMAFAVLLYLCGQFVISGPSALATMLVAVTAEEWIPWQDVITMEIVGAALQNVVTLITSVLYLPLQLAATTLMYFDLRVRTEGLDLILQAESTAGGEIDSEEILAQVPALERQALVTWPEVGYFALLSVIGIALYAVLTMLIVLLITPITSLGSL